MAMRCASLKAMPQGECRALVANSAKCSNKPGSAAAHSMQLLPAHRAAYAQPDAPDAEVPLQQLMRPHHVAYGDEREIKAVQPGRYAG
jgi:hypothetical protein